MACAWPTITTVISSMGSLGRSTLKSALYRDWIWSWEHSQWAFIFGAWLLLCICYLDCNFFYDQGKGKKKFTSIIFNFKHEYAENAINKLHCSLSVAQKIRFRSHKIFLTVNTHSHSLFGDRRDSTCKAYNQWLKVIFEKFSDKMDDGI